MKKRLLLIFAAVITAAALVACGKETAKEFTVTPSAAEVTVGGTVQLTASDSGVTWSSSDEAVATVDGHGLVTGVSVGSADVTASLDGKTAKAKITVKLSAVAPVLDMDVSAKTMHIGDELPLDPKLTENGTPVSTEFTFSSSAPDKVSVDGEGNLTALAFGSAVISVSYQYNGFSDTVTVNVSVIENIVFTADKTAVEIYVATKSDNPVSDTVSISMLLVDGTVQDQDEADIEWVSADTGIATVDNGLISAVAAGNTEVTVIFTSANGTEAEIIISVSVLRESVTVDGSATADLNWDFGAETVSDKTHLRLPAELDIAEADVLSIEDAEGNEIGKDNFMAAKSALVIGNNDVKIYTDEFIYDLTVNVTDSYKHITDYDKQFTSPPDAKPTQKTIIGEMDGRTDVVQFTTQKKETGGIWYHHCGNLTLNNYNPDWNGGYFMFDVKAAEGVKLGGYVFYEPALANPQPTFGLKEGQFSSSDPNLKISIVDENFEPATFVADEWNTVVINLNYDGTVFTRINILFSFDNEANAEPTTAYYSNIRYMSDMNYMILSGQRPYGYRIEFDAMNDDITIPDEYLPYWSVLAEPDVDMGEYFVGWMLDGQPYTFGNRVTGDMKLVAKYDIPATYSVKYMIQQLDGTFRQHGETVVENSSVGETAAAEIKTINGYTYNADKSTVSGQVTADNGLTLTVCYTMDGASVYGPDILSLFSYGSNVAYTAATMVGDDAKEGVMLYSASNSGADGRRLKTTTAYIPLGNYMVLNVYFTGGSSVKALVWGTSGTFNMTFYDESGKIVETPQKNVWYYIAVKVTQTAGSDSVNGVHIGLADWSTPSIYIASVCCLTETAFNNFFETAA